MNKKILSLAVAAGLTGVVAGTAQAEMHINDKGLGEALVYPFYSAANGNDTYVHIVNTTEFTKAVKVRFIEAMNSQEVLDFNLYLSPEDVWAGVITANPAEGSTGAIIRTVDNSCTVPELGTAGGFNVGELAGTQTPQGDKIRRDQPFVNFNYDDDAETPVDLTGLNRTLEGYIEVIEMGQLDPDVGLGAAAVHANGVPADCGALVSAWSEIPSGAWDTDPQTDFMTWGEDDNNGGLYGFGVVINVAEGTSVGYDAIAIDSFYAGNNLHFEPGDELPSLAQANPIATIFDGAVAMDFDFGLNNGHESVSALFMSTNIMNDYVIDPAINANTDWVVTMPTKRFFVQAAPAAEPFSEAWTGSNACEPIGMEHWDREEDFPTAPPVTQGPVFSPQPDTVPEDIEEFVLCTEVSIVQFGDESALNGSERITYGFSPEFNEGWARMGFLPADLNAPGDFSGARELTDLDGNVFHGLPITGFAVFNYQNGELEGGVLSNYAAGTTHKSESDITPVIIP